MCGVCGVTCRGRGQVQLEINQVYYFLEIFTRDYSHYSMIICGGLCMIACGGLNQMFPRMPIPLQMILSSGIITLFEFVTGVIVNLIFHVGVWDYSYLPYNVMRGITGVQIILNK